MPPWFSTLLTIASHHPSRCADCGALLEEYDDDTISLAIVVLSTFVHRDPELAAPLLLEMLQVVGRWVAVWLNTWYPELVDSDGIIPRVLDPVC